MNSCPLLSGKVDALEHPISPAQVELPAAELVEPIRFGFLGLADKAKGFPVFVELADRTTDRYGERAGIPCHRTHAEEKYCDEHECSCRETPRYADEQGSLFKWCCAASLYCPSS